MIPAIGYSRCSDQRQDRSVGDQGKEIRERAERDGYRIVKEFVEEGFSGKEKKLGRRFEFKRLIVTGPVYAGRLVWKGVVVCEAAHEPLVEPARFDRIQAVRRARYRARKRANPIRMGERGLLTPCLRCGTCSGTVRIQHARPDVGPWYDVCAMRLQNHAACPGIVARVDVLDALIVDALEARTLTDEALLAAASRWRARLAGDGRLVVDERRAQVPARIAEPTQPSVAS